MSILGTANLLAAHAERPAVSVIVPAYNASATLPGCLAALARQSPPHPAFEVIVADDGSTDDTVHVAQGAGARAVTGRHRGAADARNRGVAASRGQLVLFTDADCEPAPDWVAQLCAVVTEARADGARGVYRSQQTGLVPRFVQLEYEEKYRRLTAGQAIDFIDTYSAAYRRPVLEASGGFDPAIPYVEDQELSYRLAATGARLVFAPQAVVYHRHAGSLAAYARKKYHIGHWKVAVTLRHPTKLTRDTHTPFSQRLQHVLWLAGIVAVPLALFTPLARLALAALTICFVASSVPFVAWAWRRDRAVAAIAPGMLAIRAGSLALGWLVGVGRFLPQRRRWRRFPPPSLRG